MAELDVLCSMAMVSKEPEMCRPTVHEKCEKPFIEIKDMKHPCLRN
jgi:DNA mismatch repair ATPase MutS